MSVIKGLGTLVGHHWALPPSLLRPLLRLSSLLAYPLPGVPLLSYHKTSLNIDRSCNGGCEEVRTHKTAFQSFEVVNFHDQSMGYEYL